MHLPGSQHGAKHLRLLSLKDRWKFINSFSVTFFEREMDNWKRLYTYEKLPEQKESPATADVDPINKRPSRTRRPYDEWRADKIPYTTVATASPTPKEKAPYTTMATQVPKFEPSTYAEATHCNDTPHWIESMKDEINSLVTLGTWTLEVPPKGTKIISSKWVYKVKTVDGNFERYKSRVVAKGFMQRYGIHYYDTYAPVPSLATIRLLTTEAFMRDMSIDQLDICTAYLYSDLPASEVVYMKQPKGFIKEGHEEKACRLLKSIYGLKQAGHRWHHTFVDFLVSIHFVQLIKDFCVFIMRYPDGRIAVIIVYVDDIILACNNEELRQQVKTKIGKRFKTKDLGALNFILGMRITRTATTLKFDQTAYLNKILHEFGMADCKACNTPMESKRDLEVDPNEPITSFAFASLHGMLAYLANATRADIAPALNILAQYLRAPQERHTKAIKKVVRFLKGTRERGLTYHRNNKHPLFGCSDSNYAAETNARSRTGLTIIRAGAAIMWRTVVQNLVHALSVAEAEYYAGCDITKVILWVRELLNELGWTINGPTLIQIDNQSAIKMGMATESMSRTKHIAVKQMITAYYRQGDIDLQYVPTDENPSDHFTKPLGKVKFAKHTMTIMGKPDNNQYELSKPLESGARNGTKTHRSMVSFIQMWEDSVIQERADDQLKRDDCGPADQPPRDH